MLYVDVEQADSNDRWSGEFTSQCNFISIILYIYIYIYFYNIIIMLISFFIITRS
jgi:hypothetical protein